MLIWKLDSKQPLVNKEITGYFLMNKSKLVENTPQIIATHDLSGNAISVLVAQVKGLVTTHSTICTHLGCTVGVNGGGILCPCHGSQYNAMTGAVTHGPALRPLAPFPSKVIDGEIYVLGK
jgi:Rieske Fe-S protein